MPDLESLKFKIVADSSSATAKLNELSKSIEKLEKTLGGVGKGAGKFSAGLGLIKTGANSAKSTFKGLGTALGDVKIGFIALIAAALKLKDGLASCAKQSMDFVETMNLFNVSMGDNAIAAGEFAEKVQQAFGIDMAQWMRNQGVFQTLIEGFGVASEKADLMSQQLTQLGYDLSSLFNLPFADSMQKLQSGIAGELEPLRRLGYDLSQAKLQQIAYDHGIQQTVASMTQAEKSQLRYYAIMTQVTTAHGDMARTIMQPANMLRVFKENVVIAARSIGNLLIPVMQAFLSVAIVVARGIAKVANVIASLFGIQTDWRGFMDDLNYNGGGGVEDLADDLDDVGGAAGGATKKMKEFKKQFLGFDKINNITLPTEPSGGGGGGGAGGAGGGDFDLPLPTYDFLNGIEDAFAQAHPRLQKLFDDLSEDFKNGGHNIGRILGEALRDALMSIKWDHIKSVGKNIAERIADGLNDFLETPNLFKVIANTLAQSLNTAFSTAKAFADAFHWDSLGKAISDSINQFFKSFDFTNAGATLSAWVQGIFEAAITAVKNVDWSLVAEKIADFLAGIKWSELISDAIELAGLLIKGVAEFTISFVKNVAYKILKWLYEHVTGEILEVNVKDSDSKYSEKVSHEYEETSTFKAKETSSYKKTTKKYDALGDKTITATTKGKTTSSTKDTAEFYGGIEDKTVTATTEGEITKSSKDALKQQNQFKDKKVTTSLKGDRTQSIYNLWYNWYSPFKDKSVWTSLKGDRTQSIYNLWYNWYAQFKDDDCWIKLYGDATSFKAVLSDAVEQAVVLKGGVIAGTKAAGGLYRNGKWVPITAAAGGGAFNTGQMFVAREAGPELVGRIGGHTAVMNNDQIVSSVAAGVASANAPQTTLLQQLLNAVQSGDQQIVLQLDSTKFGEASIRSINRVQRQQGRTLLQV